MSKSARFPPVAVAELKCRDAARLCPLLCGDEGRTIGTAAAIRHSSPICPSLVWGREFIDS
jgi:hypothetical protein